MRQKKEEGGAKEGGGKKNRRSKKVVEKYFAMVWRRKKGGGGFPSRFRAHLFLLSCYFLFILASAFLPAVFSFFIAIVALIALMAQFCFRFSTLFAAPIPHKSIFLGCTISCKSSFSKPRYLYRPPRAKPLFTYFQPLFCLFCSPLPFALGYFLAVLLPRFGHFLP